MFITTLFSSENLEKTSLQLKGKEQFQSAGFHVSLTQEEKQYIKDKKAINVCIKSDQEPLVIKDKEGYSGISIDYLELVSKSTNMKFNYLYNHNMEDYVNGVKNGKCDMMSLILTKQNQYKFLTPTIVAATDEVVIVTAIDEPYLSTLNDLNNENIMVQKDAKDFIKYIKHFYPDLNLVEVPKMDLQRVVSGEFYGAVGGSYLMAYTIISKYPYRLKVMTKIGEKIEGSFGVSNREPLLLSILNKSIVQMSPSEKQKIIHSYKSVKVEKQIDYLFTVKVVAVFLLVSLMAILLYFREKRLSKAIQNEKNKFQNIFYKASDGISILTNGIFTDCNDSLVKLLGYANRDQVLNLTLSQLSPEYQPNGEKSLDKFIEMMNIAKEVGVNHFEWRHIRANGEVFWADIMLTDISTKENETMIHVVWRDIQHRKELEEELVGLNSSLEEKVEMEVQKNKEQQFLLMQQSRLAQMGEMISMIAHQWRQPLNNLSMIIQSAALKHKLGKLDEARMLKLSEDSQKQIMQMSQTIDDFRYFFKPNKHQREFNVTTSILHVLTLLKPSLEQELIVVETHLEDDVLMKGFSNELEQVLLNILNNARDVLVEKNRDKKKIITIVLKKEDENVLITIEDNAGGIEDNVIDKIFDPYFSTKEGRNGTGLGLYMSKSIIEGQCQGQLSVKNGTKGAIFKIVLEGGIDT